MIVHCPSCGYSRTSSDTSPATQCPACGIVFEEWLASSKARPTNRQVVPVTDSRPTPKAGSVAKWWHFVLAGVVLLFWIAVISNQQQTTSSLSSVIQMSTEGIEMTRTNILAKGYPCDSISAVIKLPTADGLRVRCDSGAHNYKILVDGLRWTILPD